MRHDDEPHLVKIDNVAAGLTDVDGYIRRDPPWLLSALDNQDCTVMCIQVPGSSLPEHTTVLRENWLD